MIRDHTALEPQPADLGDPLVQLADAPQLPGEPDLPDGRQVTGDGLVQVTGGQCDDRGQVCGGLVQLQAADDVQIGVAGGQLQAASSMAARL